MISKKPTTGKSRAAAAQRLGPKPGKKAEAPSKSAGSAKGGSKKGPTKETATASQAAPRRSSTPAAKSRPGGNSVKERAAAPAKERPAAATKERAAAPGKGKTPAPAAKERAAASSAKERAPARAAKPKGNAVAAKGVAAPKKSALSVAGRRTRAAKDALSAQESAESAAFLARHSPDSNGYVVINGRKVRMMSLSAKPIPTRRPKRTEAAAVAEPALDPDKPIRTKLSKRELDHYRTLLLGEREQLVGDLAAMEDQALRSSGGNLSHMPIHMADLGTDTFDQDFMLGMAENERRRLREIDEALMRILNGTYGVCVITGKPIPKQRLDAKPWARTTIEAAREIERGLTE